MQGVSDADEETADLDDLTVLVALPSPTVTTVRTRRCRAPGRGCPGRVAHPGRGHRPPGAAADLELLADLDQQIEQAEVQHAELVPASPFRP